MKWAWVVSNQSIKPSQLIPSLPKHPWSLHGTFTQLHRMVNNWRQFWVWWFLHTSWWGSQQILHSYHKTPVICSHENSRKHSKRAWGTTSDLYTVTVFPLCLTGMLLEEPKSIILNSGDLMKSPMSPMRYSVGLSGLSTTSVNLFCLEANSLADISPHSSKGITAILSRIHSPSTGRLL